MEKIKMPVPIAELDGTGMNGLYFHLYMGE